MRKLPSAKAAKSDHENDEDLDRQANAERVITDSKIDGSLMPTFPPQCGSQINSST
jgi:hypothetical protein